MRSRSDYTAIYQKPLSATRSGPLFNAHAYSTKISPESIALLIASHTNPGDLIFDGFGGSCTTAVGALLCSNPTKELIAAAKSHDVGVKWGPRRAIVYELSGLGSFIGQTFCERPDPDIFTRSAMKVLAEAERRVGWMYSARDGMGQRGVARYLIWSDILLCPFCGTPTSMWDGCVRFNPVRIETNWECRSCGRSAEIENTARRFGTSFDPLINKTVRSKDRLISRVEGVGDNGNWYRTATIEDAELLDRIEAEKIPKSVPAMPMMGKGGAGWGDLWRGYHDGISHVHQFYTRRNLVVLGVLHDLVENEPRLIRNALRLWVSSYNFSHSTLMTRVVAKQGHDELVLTSAQPGVLYISGLPVEKNVILGLRRKLVTIKRAFDILKELNGQVEVRQGSCLKTSLRDHSVDYVVTDPPFGGNIPYSEVNFLSEAWLDRPTSSKEEAVVSPAQDKGAAQYQDLLFRAFSELKRILKPEGKATVVFHSTQSEIWQALTYAYSRAGFSVECSNVLNKHQGSFKQVTTHNFAKGDAMLLLRGGTGNRPQATNDIEDVLRKLIVRSMRTNDRDEAARERLYSRFIEHYVRKHTAPPLNADEFYRRLQEHTAIM